MNKLIRGAALTLAAITLFTTTVFAAAVPLRETFEKAGFTVTWNQETKTVTIEKDDFTFSESVGENITLDYDTTYTTDEFVNEIYADYNREALSTNATVKEFGEGYILADTEKLGTVCFMVDENTFYHHEMNRRLYTFSDITVGVSLKIYFGETMTASLPPQTYATEVVFLNTQGKLVVSELSQVFTVSETGEGYILASNENMGEVMFMVDDKTSFRHEMNRRLYTIAAIEAGMNLQITFGEAMTASIPPQVYATDVVFLNSAPAEEAALTKTGKITEIGEGYFVIETENGEYQFNVDEETFYHHTVNRMLYRFESLEDGTEVEVVHSDAATFSLPPQSYASEVIIK